MNHTLELLMSAFDGLMYAGDFETTADPRGWVRKSNILFDACLDAGMSHDESDHIAWAAKRITRFLCAA